MQILGSFVEPTEELLIGRQLGETRMRNEAEQPPWITIDCTPGLRVDGLEKVERLRMP
jgi:hypothetical protein